MYCIDEDIKKASCAPLFLRYREEFKNLSDEILVLAALSNQARLSYHGIENTVQDFERANGLFEFLRQSGSDISSSYYLGMMYEEGHFVVQSDQKALEYYLEACSPVNLNHEWQVGFSKKQRSDMMVRVAKLIMNRGVIPTNIDVEFAYSSAIACLLSAAENGNSMAIGLLQCMKYMGSMCISPIELLDKANNEEVERIQQLIYCYGDAARLFPCLYEECLKWCATGEKIGDKKCIYLRAKYIIEEDNVRLTKYASKSQYYCFAEELYPIVRHCVPPRMEFEKKIKSQFIVHSQAHIKMEMDYISKFYHIADSSIEFQRIGDILIKFIEEHSIFEHCKPEAEESALLKIRKVLDEQRYNPAWEASAANKARKSSPRFYFQGSVELFSDEWIARRVSVQRTKTRGKDLYSNGAVLSINCTGRQYKSRVCGSTGKIYECNFTIGLDKSIVNWHCNCPAFAKYDKACKHLVASFYAARDFEKR